ncbi:MAG: 30S ribosomal protein S16 [Planctomycetota bacterium]|jgi:small subunit ribosomal protein S16
MAVKIRLKRFGRTNRPHYRICVFDGRTRRDGTPIEEIGSYDPAKERLDDKVRIDAERALYWLGVGAQPSETVASILRKKGLRKGGSVPVEPAKPAPAEPAATEAPATEAPATAEPDASAEASKPEA